MDLVVEGDWKWGRGEREEVRSMEEHSDKGTLFFYGLPAYGHTLSNLYLAGRLAGAGFRVTSLILRSHLGRI